MSSYSPLLIWMPWWLVGFVLMNCDDIFTDFVKNLDQMEDE